MHGRVEDQFLQRPGRCSRAAGSTLWCRFQGSRKLPALVTRATAQAASRRRMQVLAARFQCPNRASRIGTKLHFLKLVNKDVRPDVDGS